MTKSELIEVIARKQKHLPTKDVELAVKHLLELMSGSLSGGDRIEIRGFGSFSLHFRPPRMGRNPKTGEAVALSGKVRHVWRHGVPKLDEGTRISLSWRYLQSVGAHAGTVPDPKVPTKNFKIKEPPKILIFSLCDGIGAVPFAAESMWPNRVKTHAWEILEFATKIAVHNI